MVVDVVRRRHLKASRTEVDVNVFIFNDRYLAPYQRHDDVLALEPLVLRVVGVYAHGGVTHDGFRACRCHNGVTAGLFYHHVAQVVKLGMLILIYHFLVGECCLGLWIPVDHAHSTVDEALVVQVAEHFDNAFRAFVVHSECRSVPVAARAKLP